VTLSAESYHELDGTAVTTAVDLCEPETEPLLDGPGRVWV